MKHLLYACCMIAIFASCNPPASTNAGNDQGEKNKATLQRFYDEVFNKHNAVMIDSLSDPNFVDHNPGPGYDSSLASVKKSFGDMFAGFPDMHVTVISMIADSNTVWARINMTGTNSGPMMGMPATNKKMNVDGVDIIRFKNGKAVERWGYMEESKMMVQMGMMPDPAAAVKPDSTKPADAAAITTTTTTKVTTKETTKETKKK